LSASGQTPAEKEAAASRPGSRSFWSDAYAPLPIERRARESGLILIQLENSLLKRLLELQAVESRLWRAVSRRRARAGRRAVRQIERERQRLGRELHTGVGQLLAAIRLQLEVIATHLPNPAAPVQQSLDRIGSLAAEALDQVRAVSRRLHPPEWQRLKLDDAVRQLWEMSGVPQRFAGAMDLSPLASDPDPEVKTLIYRAAQEALSNIVRHAKAARVDLALSHANGQLHLAVHDDGVGFDPALALAARPDISAGIGLRSIREQAADLGGKLLVRSGPLGTTLEVFVPYSMEPEP
jgi:two-component system NarL family sensor kinase